MSISKRAGTPQPGGVAREQTGVVVAREERRFPRRQLELTASVGTLDAERDPKTGTPYYVLSAGMTLDLGDGGVGLQVEGHIDEGRRVVVDIDAPDGRKLEYAARVAWAVTNPVGQCYVGLSFDTVQDGLANSL